MNSTMKTCNSHNIPGCTICAQSAEMERLSAELAQMRERCDAAEKEVVRFRCNLANQSAQHQAAKHNLQAELHEQLSNQGRIIAEQKAELTALSDELAQMRERCDAAEKESQELLAACEAADATNKYYENALYYPGVKMTDVQDGNSAIEIAPQKVSEIIARAEAAERALEEAQAELRLNIASMLEIVRTIFPPRSGGYGYEDAVRGVKELKDDLSKLREPVADVEAQVFRAQKKDVGGFVDYVDAVKATVARSLARINREQAERIAGLVASASNYRQDFSQLAMIALEFDCKSADDLRAALIDAKHWRGHINNPSVWIALFDRPPCFFCGYNGDAYYQPDTHSCAKKFHELSTAIDAGLGRAREG